MYIRELLIKVLNEVGLQFWWPIDIDYHKKTGGYWELEVILGAILTQNTKWEFVERNIAYLKEKGFIFTPDNLINLKIEDIKVPMRKRKYETIINFYNFFIENFSDITEFKKEQKEKLRENILKIKGIGNETADTILLFAAEKPEMVIDSYTLKLLYENKITKTPGLSYNKAKKMLEEEIKRNADEIRRVIIQQLKKLNREEILREKYNGEPNDNLPLNPFDIIEKEDENQVLTILYKEIHASIDEYCKRRR
ncbi:MAG: hypothetical protein BXU00_02055 [Candidatus Nanoclepta minutus]|uniref:HhH-GPD domain-containing protein n=1 Tax=Candidatus Nanoclepta minutus TaxID=1940235 RepID=A0A397WN00_9ARCH|nr:MAG: hypothetical protein BXU00_02055 [Candidatus Nanoclepta minutus]